MRPVNGQRAGKMIQKDERKPSPETIQIKCYVFMVWGLGFRIQSVGFRVSGIKFRFQRLG